MDFADASYARVLGRKCGRGEKLTASQTPGRGACPSALPIFFSQLEAISH